MKYFGTDGIRGVFGEKLTVDLAYRVGLALTLVFGKGDYVVGRDTRKSGAVLESALVSGIIAGGGNAVTVGVTPTPVVSFTTTRIGANCGVVISASHNPPEYNGIKVFGGDGFKIVGEIEDKIERLLAEDLPGSERKGKVLCLDAEKPYLDFITAGVDLMGVRVALDCGFGASYGLAPRAFRMLGAEVFAVNNQPIGDKINVNCGALYPELMQNVLREKGCDYGFSFDGDADRVAVSDGEIVDGDSVIYSLSKGNSGAVVGTEICNLALERRVLADGKAFYRVPVGDKLVSRKLHDLGEGVGGEPSGHFVLYPTSKTGDGLLTAITVARLKGGIERLELTPHAEGSFFGSADVLERSEVKEFSAKIRGKLFGNGRLLLRASGTEPKVRIMVEGRTEAEVKEIVAEFGALIARLNEKTAR